MMGMEHGDPEAWAEIYNHYKDPLYRFCSRFVKNHEEAEDLLHEIFLRVQERSEQFLRGAPLRPWLYGIARHACLDHIKKKKLPRWQDCWSSRIIEEKMVDSTESPLSKMVHSEEYQHLNACLEDLNEDVRSAVLLKHVEGLSRQEIGEIMGLSESKVKNLLFSGMQALKKKISKNF